MRHCPNLFAWRAHPPLGACAVQASEARAPGIVRISLDVLLEPTSFAPSLNGGVETLRRTSGKDGSFWARARSILGRANLGPAAKRASKDRAYRRHGCRRGEETLFDRASHPGKTVWPDQIGLFALASPDETLTRAVHHSTAYAPEAFGEKGDSMRARFILSFAQKSGTGAKSPVGEHQSTHGYVTNQIFTKVEWYIRHMNPDPHLGIDNALQDIQLLDHPFYRRWEAGELKREELTHYAEQYRFFEAMLPSFLQELSAQLSPSPAKDFVDANLADEVTPPTHVDLFEAFARFYGASAVSISPAMSHLVDSYAQVLRRGPSSALAGLFAYESQGGAIADSKSDGLSKHYGASDEALVFWNEHGSIEGDHAQWTFDALSSLEPDLDEVAIASRFVGQAWWAFLDERELLSV